MNSGCVACGCQLIPLSGSAQREIPTTLTTQTTQTTYTTPTTLTTNTTQPSYSTPTANYKLQITNYKLQITNYKLQITNYKLQIATGITKCDTIYYKLRQVLQSAMDLLQIATGITRCDDHYKLRQCNVQSLNLSSAVQYYSKSFHDTKTSISAKTHRP